MDIATICKEQREYFKKGATKKLEFRLAALRNLQKALLENEEDILAALKEDLGKSACEAYMCELGLVHAEIAYMLKELKSLTKASYHSSPLSQAISECYTIAEPYGTVLILSPWNYPLQLTLIPLISALSAGNTAVIKPSAYAPATSKVLSQLISCCFAPEYVALVSGSREENQELLGQHFDYIFFTGSRSVGKLVLRKAAKYMTPVTLELGGKSPCIVDSTANIPLAAKRIVFGKYLNLGQTCVAPDYLLVDNQIKAELLTQIELQISKQFGEEPLQNPDYGKIINKKHFDRLIKLIKREKVIIGGKDDGDLRIEPTVLDKVALSSPIMKEEIFGPILPVIGFDNIEEIYPIIERNPNPLALYLFTGNNQNKTDIIGNISFGGGCINDTIMQVANVHLPFGGVGESGMGAYHGKAGFATFSHYKSMVNKLNVVDPDVRYQPYDEKKYKHIRSLLK